MDLSKLMIGVLFLAAMVSAVGIIYSDMTTRYGVTSNVTQFTALNQTAQHVEALTETLEANLLAVQYNPLAIIIIAPATFIQIALTLTLTLVWTPPMVMEVANVMFEGIPVVILGLIEIIFAVLIIVALIRFIFERQEGQGI